MKRRIYNILSVSENSGDLSWWVDIFIIALIVLNVLAVILESVDSILVAYSFQFAWFEIFSVAIFTIEYLLRLWTANLEPGYEKPLTGRLRYALTPLALIDLLAILPFYLMFMGMDLRLLRLLRLFRMFRLFKIARYISALRLINQVVKQKREELSISLFLTLFILLMVSTVMYYVENRAQPEQFSSIPETMWWGIATLTTVGYGDVYPITGLGKLLGGVIAIIGVGLFALPAGILASGFSDALSSKNKKTEQNNFCPRCGQKLQD
ncbi:MAG TPA: ion transporter [Saprospiraceae bacterium]|nr:ion transporter [Saprospiraceae bacterium]HMP24869.1 ion transporter [Saprospiraceae bacterium]